jgi:hypothetical protein
VFGTKGLINGVFVRRIGVVAGGIDTIPSQLVSAFEAEAVAAGAKQLQIIADITNPKIISPNILSKFGFTLKRIGDSPNPKSLGVYEFTKNLCQ